MMIPDVKQKWANSINVVTIGATKEAGGTRSHTVSIGGATALPFLHFEGKIPYKPVVAMEILDIVPEDWHPLLGSYFSDVWNDPVLWAKKCVEEYGADLICLR
ncbi:unnamed protein product, partial [marine sediment metagenome]